MGLHRIKEVREKNKLSQQKFADLIGANIEDIISWEEGDSAPGIVEVMKICNLFNVSADYLLFGKENNQKRKICFIIIAFNIYAIVFLTLITQFMQYFEFLIFHTCYDDAILYLYEYPLNGILVFLVVTLLLALTHLLFSRLKKFNLR